MLWLFILFLLLPIVVAIVLVVSGSSTVVDVLAAWLVHVSIAVAYVQTYPALREQIPSFRILLAISAAGERGLDRDDLMLLLGEPSLFSGKISDLSNDGLMREVDGRLVMTRAGRLLAQLFSGYRRVLGLGSGRG